MYPDNVTIVVMSCDKYETAWYPFFELLKKYWQNHPANIVLCTDTKQYTHDGLSITCIANGSIGQWSDRLLDVLQKVNTEYVLLSLEDFFLQAPVRNDIIKDCITYMECSPTVAQFRLKNCDHDEQISTLGREILPDFYEAGSDVIYRFDTQIALWNREILMKYVVPGENPWQFETRGTQRVLSCPYQFLWYKSKSDPGDVKSFVFPYHILHRYGYGITAGHWLWNNKKLFHENGLYVDLSVIGTYSKFQYKFQNYMSKALYQNPSGFHYKVFAFLYHVVKKVKQTLSKVCNCSIMNDRIM